MKYSTRLLRLLTVLLLVALPVALAESDSEAVIRKLVGTWRLVSWTAGTNQQAANRGPHPLGILYYDAFGNMAAQIMPDRTRRTPAGLQPTPEEARDMVLGYAAYFGTYTLNTKTRIITHHIKGNINPAGTGESFRHYQFLSDDKLYLINDATGDHLIWERVK